VQQKKEAKTFKFKEKINLAAVRPRNALREPAPAKHCIRQPLSGTPNRPSIAK
jgi:hypothetical protein